MNMQLLILSNFVCKEASWFVVILIQAVVVLRLQQIQKIKGQQPYINNHQLDCYNQSYINITRGYECTNGLNSSSCQAYLTFRSNPSYSSAVSIEYLMKTSQPNLIASINNLTNVTATLPTHTLVVIPVNCSCSGEDSYYQHNATYRILNPLETYFTVANNTYQGLTTCQALMSQNSVDYRHLTVGLDLLVPLRCACPTPTQTASGFNYLLTYMVTWGDTISSISRLFNVDQQSVLDANELSEGDIIFPFTPILVPLKTPPSPKINLHPPPPPQTPLTPPQSSSSSSKKWRIYVVVGVGASLLPLIAIFCFYRRKPKPSEPAHSTSPGPTNQNLLVSDSADYPLFSGDSKPLSQGFRSAVESLTLYKFQDLQTATGYFGEENRIKGSSVYKGSFKGDDAAIKVMKGDVSSEINILKKINHSNIIRLSGFCVNEGNTYLVYEFADNGALGDWLHSSSSKTTSHCLTWKQRVQIAYDVANAINYLHKYTNPSYVHKNLKTSNILLDTNLRAKISNFGLARSVNHEHQQGGLQLTRHVVGTYGYMAPEYIENGVITPKLDVFALGVLILELLSAREAVTGDKISGWELLYESVSRVLEEGNVREKLRGFIDPSLKNEYPLDLAFSVAQVAQNCTSHDLNARPSISEVFGTLSKILSSLSDWDPSDEFDNSNSRSFGSDR